MSGYGNRVVGDDGHTADHNAIEIAAAAETAARIAAVNLRIPLSQRGAANGVATLGSDGKITPAQERILSVAGRTGTITLTKSDISDLDPDGGGQALDDEIAARIAADAAHVASTSAHSADHIAFSPTLTLLPSNVQAALAASEITANGVGNAHPKLVGGILTLEWPAVFGIDSAGIPYYNSDGATPGEEASMVLTEFGQLKAVQLNLDSPEDAETITGSQARINVAVLAERLRAQEAEALLAPTDSPTFTGHVTVANTGTHPVSQANFVDYYAFAGQPVVKDDAGNITLLSQQVDLVTYTPSITIDASATAFALINATNSVDFTIESPTSPFTGRRLVIDIRNSSGGSMGAVTFDSVFALAESFVAPANDKRRLIEFYFDGSNWTEISRSVGDI